LADFASPVKPCPQIGVKDPDGADAEVAANLVVVHWRTEILRVYELPQAVILHEGQEEEALLAYWIVVRTKAG